LDYSSWYRAFQAEAGREQCQKAKDKENLELGAATAVVALAVLLGWLCLPQEAKHPGNVRFIVSLLLSFATFLSGNALMLLSLNLLGRLREDLVSGSQRAASKCTLLLVACAVLSVLTLLSVMVALLPGRVYRYIGLAVVVAVLPPAAGAHWYLRRRAGGGGVEAACAEDREELDAASKITSSVTNSAFGGLIGVLFSASKASSAVSRAAYVSTFLVFATSISGMFVMTVSKKVPEITNLRFRRFLVAAIKLANCVLLCLLASAAFAAAFVVLGITAVLCLLLQYCVASHGQRGSRDNNPREQENQEARVKASHCSLPRPWLLTGQRFGGPEHTARQPTACVLPVPTTRPASVIVSPTRRGNCPLSLVAQLGEIG
jgi:hypothetical protein